MEMTNNLFNKNKLYNISEHKMNLLVIIGVILVVILGIIVTGIAVKINKQPTQSAVTRFPIPTIYFRSEMWIDPVSTTISAGQEFTVQVMIDAKNTEINGTDAIINYDPAYLKVLTIEKSNEPNNEFQLFARQSENQLQITSVKLSRTDLQTAQLTVALITFRAIKAGSTLLVFEHAPYSTTGSTIIQARNNENILDSVRGMTIQIQ